MSKAPSRSQEQFIVRFPDGMRERIKAAAEAHGRSMNAEIIHTLLQTYPEDPSRDPLIETLMQFVRDAEDDDDMKARVEAANKEMLGTRFANQFTIGLVTSMSTPSGALEMCPAVFEMVERDEPGGPVYEPKLKWLLTPHFKTENQRMSLIRRADPSSAPEEGKE